MAVAKRQGREKPAKIEQRRSEDQSEDLRGNKQHSWLAQFTQDRPRERETYTQRSQSQLSLSPMRWGTLLLVSLDRPALTPQSWIFLLSSK